MRALPVKPLFHDLHRRYFRICRSLPNSTMPTASSRRRGLDVHYVPGEHDIIDEERGKLYRERYGRGTKGAGWYSFDADGVHFIGLVNVVD